MYLYSVASLICILSPCDSSTLHLETVMIYNPTIWFHFKEDEFSFESFLVSSHSLFFPLCCLSGLFIKDLNLWLHFCKAASEQHLSYKALFFFFFPPWLCLHTMILQPEGKTLENWSAHIHLLFIVVSIFRPGDNPEIYIKLIHTASRSLVQEMMMIKKW